MIALIYGIIAQINLEGFEEAAQQNTLFAILVSMVLVLFSIVLYLFKKYEDKNDELKKLQEDYIKRIDDIRIDNTSKEAERNNQWRESEKETLIVLKGVNSVLEMSEKLKENDTQKIIEKIASLEKTISNSR